MGILLTFVAVAFIIFAFGSVSFLNKGITKSIAIFMVFCATLAYFNQLGLNDNKEYTTAYIYIFYIAIFAFAMYYVRLFTKPEPLDIIADRQRYWEEVTDKDIYKFYSNRRDIKKDRVEAVNINKFETKLIIKSENDTQIINPQFFLNLKKIDGNLTHADSVKEISKYKVYNAIFKRLKTIIDDKEIRLDYEEILKEHNNFLEYFIMNLWEKYTGDTNIGIANLNIICKRWIEEECVYAIDLLHLNNVKLKGSAMYYAYKSYKGENKSNNVSILETLPVNPNFKEDDIF